MTRSLLYLIATLVVLGAAELALADPPTRQILYIQPLGKQLPQKDVALV